MEVDAGEVGIIMVNKDAKKGAAIVIATINDDKTIADLEAWPSTDQPPWLQVVDFATADPGREILLVEPFTNKPLFVVCFDFPPEAKIGQLGPIVKK